jgi:sporulation protein YlmC with PRC-barrel domain
MKFSEAQGRKVVSTSSAETVGIVSDYIIDPKKQAVVAIALKKTKGHEDTILWRDLTAFGEDAVIVANEDVVVSASGDLAELSDKRHQQHGKRVLSSMGVELGAVDDVEFDPQSGTITNLILKDTQLAGDLLLAVGSYAVIVKAII